MNVESFNNLELIPKLLEEIRLIKESANKEKRWLTVTEVAKYIGYSKDRIHALTNSEFLEGIHYYKKGKLLFDRYALDNWITNSNSKIQPKEIVNQILKDIV